MPEHKHSYCFLRTLSGTPLRADCHRLYAGEPKLTAAKVPFTPLDIADTQRR